MYLFEYRHAGRVWGIQIAAADTEDAMARLRSLTFARYRGEVIANVPVPVLGVRGGANRLRAHLTRLLGRGAKG